MSAEDNGVPADPPEVAADGLQDSDEVPRTITLDRYLSRRRPPVRMGWPQALSMLAMLVGLIMILVYKDGCGTRVSGLMNAVAPSPAEDKSAPAVRYVLPPDHAEAGGDSPKATVTKPVTEQPSANNPQ